ncbi:hypothetical protein Lser_V15G33523 [Lactuca serriola]
MVYLMAWHLRKLQAQIKDLEDERVEQANEMKQCKKYISKLVIHAEAQALQYQQKVIGKDEAASHDNKRLFYSTLKNDNPLDCIVSKVKVLKITPGVNLKSIPPSDYYYDMKYNIDYSTFSTIKNDVPCIKEEIHSNGSNDTNINGTNNNLKHKK